MTAEEPSALMAARDSAKRGWPLGQVTVAALVEMIDRANARSITAEATIARVREVLAEWDRDEDAKGLHFDLTEALDGGAS